MTSFGQRLDEKIRSCGTPALVGIDPRWDMLPASVQLAAAGGRGTIAERTATAFESFSRQIIEIVAPLVPAIKPQVAFFEQLGVPGCRALHAIMTHARRAGLLVIADAKRGDIGSTAEAYADAWLAGEDPEAAAWPADALTVNPYLGSDSLKPFVDVATRRGAGLYVLVRTSNPVRQTFRIARPAMVHCMNPSADWFRIWQINTAALTLTGQSGLSSEQRGHNNSLL